MADRWARAVGDNSLYFENGSIDKTGVYTKTVSRYWEFDSAETVDLFATVSLSQPGTIVVETLTSGSTYYYVYFVTSDIRIDRLGWCETTQAFQVKVTWTYRLLDQRSDVIEPWKLPPYDFSIAGADLEVSTSEFFPGEDDLFYPSGSIDAVPFVNSAGGWLEAVGSKSRAQIKFSYNLQSTAFNSTIFWWSKNKINNDNVTICGLSFAPRQCMITDVNASYRTTTSPTNVSWGYFKVDVTLLADYNGFDQKFLNVGTHLKRNGGLARIWSWTSLNAARNAVINYGDKYEYLASGATDGEPVTEPMFLTADGSAVSPVGADGRQIPTYRIGTTYQPASFSDMGFPASAPTEWFIP